MSSLVHGICWLLLFKSEHYRFASLNWIISFVIKQIAWCFLVIFDGASHWWLFNCHLAFATFGCIFIDVIDEWISRPVWCVFLAVSSVRIGAQHRNMQTLRIVMLLRHVCIFVKFFLLLHQHLHRFEPWFFNASLVGTLSCQATCILLRNLTANASHIGCEAKIAIII